MEKKTLADMAPAIQLLPSASDGPRQEEPAHKDAEPRYSLRRFLLGGTAVLGIAALAWPSIPRIYESTATIVLRPTDAEGQADYAQAMRQPLDESFILSDLDELNSVALAETVIDTHQLAMDDEFRPKPGIGDKAQDVLVSVLSGLLPALNLSSGALLVVYGAVILLTVALGSERFADMSAILIGRRSK